MRGLDIAALTPPRNDRVLLSGQTGSGKSTLARVLLQSREYVVICDAKRQIKWPGYQVFTDLQRLRDVDPVKVKKIIYKPSFAALNEWQEQGNDSEINRFFQWVYERQNTTLYVDELALVSKGNIAPFYYGACMMQGRELDIEVISGTQRPTGIPQVVISEAEHVYVFKLKLDQDRDRIERVAGIPQGLIARLQKREFLYAPQDGEIVGPIRLELASRAA